MFLPDRSYVSRARCIGFISPLVVLAPSTRFKCGCLRASLLTVLRVVYVIVRLSSGKTRFRQGFVSILHVDLISCRYF